MSIRNKIAALAIVPALAAFGLIVSAAGASAGNNPNPCITQPAGINLTAYQAYGWKHHPHPCPTQTETTPPPVPTPFPRFRQQDIDLNIGNGNVNGYVDNNGPIQGTGGTTKSINPFLDVVTVSPGNTYNLHHEGLLGAQVDLQTCSITVDENDLPWFIFRGTGLYRNAIGFGHYTMRGVFSFPTHWGKCPELASVSIDPNRDLSGQLSADNLNPSFFDIAVQATGAVRLSRPCHFASQVPGVVQSDAPALVQG